MTQDCTVKMVHVCCDLCGRDAATPRITPVTYFPDLETTCAIVTCNSCGLMYTCPRPTQQGMPGLYQSYYAAQDAGRPSSTRRQGTRLRAFFRPLWHRYCGQYLAEVIGKARGAVLEVGCGAGDLLQDLAMRGCRVHGVDINPASVRVCQEKGCRT